MAENDGWPLWFTPRRRFLFSVVCLIIIAAGSGGLIGYGAASGFIQPIVIGCVFFGLIVLFLNNLRRHTTDSDASFGAARKND
jgi:hypothetical protein